MKQFPSNMKYKKYQKNNYFFNSSIEKKSFLPMDGEFAIQAVQSGKIKFKQIEACRRTIKRSLKKMGFLWIKLFTNIPVYKKSLASRMGKGKGNLAYWIAPIRLGQILFEISGCSLTRANYILNKSKTKLPLKTKVVKLIY